MTTLFEKYGGFATFSRITTNFYHKVLDTPQVAHYFSHTNMDALIDHQTQFLAKALGGPETPQMINLKAAHQNLNISEADFDLVAELLKETLQDMQVQSDDISRIMTIISNLKGDIVSE